MGRPKRKIEPGMLLGEYQLKVVKEVPAKEYNCGTKQRQVEVICPVCGNIFQTSVNAILRKSTDSKKPVKQCPACSKKDNNKRFSSIGKQSIEDLTGKVFGNLTVLNITNERRNREIIWHCVCTCGNEINVKGIDLKRGHTSSCGCIKSKGESKIIKILINLKINFETQYSFNDCINPQTNQKLYFDFYLPTYQCLIEYDGQQHYMYSNNGWNNKENYELNKQRDQIKNDYCKNKGINLIRIPYWDYDNLNEEYFKKLLNNKI